MNTLRELLDHELQDIYAVEQKLAKMLQQLGDETASKEIRKALATHRKETRQHIKRLDRIFRLLKYKVTPAHSEGLDGIFHAREAFVGLSPTDEILDCYNLHTLLKTESYEVASYEGLLDIAEKMQLLEIADLLRANLEEDRNTLMVLKRLSREFQVTLPEAGGVLRPVSHSAANGRLAKPT